VQNGDFNCDFYSTTNFQTLPNYSYFKSCLSTAVTKQCQNAMQRQQTHTMHVLRVFSGGRPPLWFLRYGCQTSALP